MHVCSTTGWGRANLQQATSLCHARSLAIARVADSSQQCNNAAGLPLNHCSTYLTHACCPRRSSLHWVWYQMITSEVISVLTRGCWAQAAVGAFCHC